MQMRKAGKYNKFMPTNEGPEDRKQTTNEAKIKQKIGTAYCLKKKKRRKN